MDKIHLNYGIIKQQLNVLYKMDKIVREVVHMRVVQQTKSINRALIGYKYL